MKDAPLREMLLLLAGIALFAWPLALVTADVKQADGRRTQPEEVSIGTRTDVEFESTASVLWLELTRQTDGEVLARYEGPAKFGDFECVLPDGMGGLVIEAQWEEGSPRAALRIEILPDRQPAASATIWGQGKVRELWEGQGDE